MTFSLFYLKLLKKNKKINIKGKIKYKTTTEKKKKEKILFSPKTNWPFI